MVDQDSTNAPILDQLLFERSIPDTLLRSCAKFPDKAAFIFGDETLSYAQICVRMRQVAGALLDWNIQRGERVALLLNQSLESAAAIYGVMAAGGVFVPIDPTSPVARIQAILAQCGVTKLVTHAPLTAKVQELMDAGIDVTHVIGLDAGTVHGLEATMTWDAVYTGPEVEGPKITSEDLAYIMWTSGSTGAPKGMTHIHRNGLIYAGMLSETHALHAGDIFVGVSPLHFDMAVMDYVAAPLVGGTTVIVPEVAMKMPAVLTALIARHKGTILYTVPFALVQMLTLGAMDKNDVTSLRWLIFGGENFPAKHLRALMALLPDAAFANAFGPAETHQISSYTLTAPPTDDEMISVGAPWRTLEPLIVDDDDAPVAAGETGELLVRSPSCMLGYWNDPDRTAAAFFERPSPNGLAQRFYRTGDLVRQEPDGNMFFLGRKGRQVKLRGFRVELDEVETAIAATAGVAEVAVVHDTQNKTLVGFVRLDSVTTPDAILKQCRAQVPVYAVPARIEILDDFPRTGSGKIDRKRTAAQYLGQE